VAPAFRHSLNSGFAHLAYEYADAIRAFVASYPLDAFALVLGGDVDFVKRGRDEYATFCPRHDDHHESLRVNRIKLVFICDPCVWGGDLFDLYAVLHALDVRDDFPRVRDELGALLGIPRTAGAYAYRGPRKPTPRRPSTYERLVAKIAQAPAPIPQPECCRQREAQCGHWLEFDREYLVAVLRDNLASTAREVVNLFARAHEPLTVDELIAELRVAVEFGAIVPDADISKFHR
jgi:hypothetical protein